MSPEQQITDSSEAGDVSFESKIMDHNYDQIGIRATANPYHFDIKNLLSQYLKKNNTMHNTVGKILQSKNILAIQAGLWMRG